MINQNRAHDRRRAGEEGSAIIVALILMAVLMTVSLAAASVRVASARGTDSRERQQDDYWGARSGASAVEASLRTDIPAAYDADVSRAKGMAGARRLPSFDGPSVSPSQSRPVMNTDGQRTSNDIASCTSLLGQLDSWAAARLGIAENYAQQRGHNARVALLREAFRAQLAGSSAYAEPGYALEFYIDAAAGENGRVRPSGLVMLGPAIQGCNTAVTLDTSPSTITQGQSASLVVTYENATRVTVSEVGGAAVYDQAVAESGATQTLNVTVSPSATTTYVATATNATGCRADSAPRTLTVTTPPPRIVSFTANPSCVVLGSPSALSWSIQGATSATIDGTPVNASGGTLPVTPSATTTYTLVASNSSGSVQAQTTVSVTIPPTVNMFTADQSCVIAGDSTALRWNVNDAASVTINGTPVDPSSGSLPVAPNSITTYTLVTTGSGCAPQTVQRQITINVTTPPQINSFTGTPSTIIRGSGVSAVLDWNITGAASATINGTPVNPSAGTMSVMPNVTTTYTLVANGSGCSPQQRQATVTIVVEDDPGPGSCPVINSLSADPSCVVFGQSSQITWDTQDADTVTLNGTPVALTGSLGVTPSATTVYTLVASRNGCTTQQRQVRVDVSTPPTINAFGAAPDTLQQGQATALQWDVSDAASVTIDGVPVNPSSGSMTVAPNATHTYKLVATGDGCSPQQRQASITVTVNACPSINLFSATPTSVASGGNSVLQWSVSNAAAVTINGRPVAAAGSMAVSPTSTTSYRLVAQSLGGGCDVEQTVTVSVASCDAPSVISFAASPQTVAQGGNQLVRLSWAVSDSTGTPVSVTITPGVGTITGASGFVDISQPQATTTYTIVATNGCASSPPAQTQITVGPPEGCPVLVPGAPDRVSRAGSSGAVSAFPDPNSRAEIQMVARHYENGTLGINMRMTISNGNDPFNLRTPEVLTGGYHGHFGKYKFKFYMGQFGSFFSSFGTIRGIELYDASDGLVQTIPFDQISNDGSNTVYNMKGSGVTSGDGEVVVPYASFDPAGDRVGVYDLTVKAFDQNGSGQQIDTPVPASERPFGCTEFYFNDGATNEVVAPHNNMYITGFVETYGDGRVRADATSGGMGNEVVGGYWIKTTYDYHIILKRDGVPFKDIRYSYEHTPARPFSSPTVFELPSSEVPAGTGPVTMWAELTGTVYNRIYTETLHATIDTTQPDGTKFPGDSPPPTPVYGRGAYIGECNGDIPNACTNQRTSNGWRW